MLSTRAGQSKVKSFKPGKHPRFSVLSLEWLSLLSPPNPEISSLYPSTFQATDRRQHASPHGTKQMGRYYVVMALAVCDGLNSEASPNLNCSRVSQSVSAYHTHKPASCYFGKGKLWKNASWLGKQWPPWWAMGFVHQHLHSGCYTTYTNMSVSSRSSSASLAKP
jgi:hypothetical protein